MNLEEKMLWLVTLMKSWWQPCANYVAICTACMSELIIDTITFLPPPPQKEEATHMGIGKLISESSAIITVQHRDYNTGCRIQNVAIMNEKIYGFAVDGPRITHGTISCSWCLCPAAVPQIALLDLQGWRGIQGSTAIIPSSTCHKGQISPLVIAEAK